jgi:hypothetical protein
MILPVSQGAPVLLLGRGHTAFSLAPSFRPSGSRLSKQGVCIVSTRLITIEVEARTGRGGATSGQGWGRPDLRLNCENGGPCCCYAGTMRHREELIPLEFTGTV